MNEITPREVYEHNKEMLMLAINDTRNEPGISIREVANMFRDNWNKEDVKVLKGEL